MLKVLYAAQGTGTGTMAKAIALRKAQTRNFPNVDVAVALGTDFPELLPASNSFTSLWPASEATLETKLPAIVNQVKPDVLLVCYNGYQVRNILPYFTGHKALIWRASRNAQRLLDPIDLRQLDAIYSFENPYWDYIHTKGVDSKIVPIAPFYQVYSDEVIEPSIARQQLLAVWDIFDTGKKLRVIAHNGASFVETNNLLAAGFGTEHFQDYHTVLLSQQTRSDGRLLPRPLAAYMGAIDTLVAAPGPTVFYEWFKFKKSDAKQIWIPVTRQHDPQDWRATVDPSTILWYNGNNGADMILEHLTTL